MSDGATRTKICGITRLQDAELAVELGAWAVGMVFFDASPRACSLAEGQRITTSLRRKVELCGVFVNAQMEEIVGVSEQLGLTLLQLHGDEGPSFCGEAARRTGARVIKALQVSGMADIQDAARFHTDFHLLDARSTEPGQERLRGGTGETFDWALLAGRRSKVPLILSGGLNSGNVGEAIERVRPFAVDTASGTESAPGIKDLALLRDFFAAVDRAAFASQTQTPVLEEAVISHEPVSATFHESEPGMSHEPEPTQTVSPGEPSQEAAPSVGSPT
ncbi:MAG TPA: phosphoribosylanthranilate isomerase [Solirubrobacteraceae bacterium]|jgi:phosphoribosylanthranilate isomerase|nr:phosphoribosylanthranilate isomerase [Solirubrobacteraceae bacterium]